MAKRTVKTRQQIVDESARILREIDQIFVDCASWNENTRKPGEERIDPDPDGFLRRAKAALERTLASEAQRGSFPSGGEAI